MPRSWPSGASIESDMRKDRERKDKAEANEASGEDVEVDVMEDEEDEVPEIAVYVSFMNRRKQAHSA